MIVDNHDRLTEAATRTAGQRAPRSGGRTAARASRSDRDRRGTSGGLRTEGTAALAPTWDEGVAPGVRAEPSATGAAGRTAATLRVAPSVPGPASRAPFIALILVLVVGGVLGILLINTKINENAFRLDRLQKQQAALDLQQQQLQKQIAEHEAPGNLAAAARRLGLVESGPPAFIRLPDGKVIGVPQPAGAAGGSGQPGAGG